MTGASVEIVTPRHLTLLTGNFVEGRGYRTARAHGSDDWLLLFTLGGHGRFRNTHGAFVSARGDAVLLPPALAHDYGTDDDAQRWVFLWAHFRPRGAFSAHLAWPERLPGVRALSVDDELTTVVEGCLRRAHDLATSGRALREELAMNALEEALLRLDEVNPARLGTGDPRVARAVTFLREHLRERVTLDDVAGAAGLSVSRLSHLFRAAHGLTPMQFLERERLERAKLLLRLTARSVQDVAEDVGFEGAFYFARRFRAHEKCSPSEYRRARQREST
ncbi:helix-turn-helix domain-containing protein [Deinococcus pimensis]|uniref:helix-turn-helix domain-containing protein n=1 Tax=Deinococcus pimensis TaxID=309888 RepID=UPI0005EB1F35|nr:helix-turn-helix domain-containing protein [Deinococcus pimensis]